MDENFR
jgi:hypothetical protein